jgi:hypothetical protein
MLSSVMLSTRATSQVLATWQMAKRWREETVNSSLGSLHMPVSSSDEIIRFLISCVRLGLIRSLADILT